MITKKSSRGDNQYPQIKHDPGPTLLWSRGQPYRRISPHIWQGPISCGRWLLFYPSARHGPPKGSLPQDLHPGSNTQAFPLFKNANLTHVGIVIKLMSIGTFLVYDDFNVDLDAITIYRRIKTLGNLA